MPPDCQRIDGILKMKQTLRLLAEKTLSWLPCSRLLQLCNQQILCVYYHRFQLQPTDYFRGGYSVKSPQQFETELRMLLDRFEPVSLQHLLPGASAQRPSTKKPRLFLSFDDGYRELFDFAAPVLKRLKVPATVFITTRLLNNQQWLFEDEIGLLLHHLARLSAVQQRECQNRCLSQFGVSVAGLRSVRRRPDDVLDWLWNYLQLSAAAELTRYQPYLTDTMVSSMLHQGITVGAHGKSHTLISSLTPAQQDAEITESTAFLAERFALPYRVFAFPYGEFELPRQTLQRVLDGGKVDLLFGTRGVIRDEFHPRLLQRVWAENHSGTLSQHLQQSLAAAALRTIRGTNCVSRTA